MKVASYASKVSLFIVVLLLSVCLFLKRDHDTFSITKVIRLPGVQKPSSILKYNNRYVITELQNNRLAILENLERGQVKYFDPKSIGKNFSSPHYLALTPWGTLLTSNGWGNSVIEIADLEGKNWREFSGKGKKMNAPHGICVDDQGWIYVGDSLNSRLVRFKDMNGADYEVFSDNNRVIAYARQLVCRENTVWISNSYEQRPGLNPGSGGNVLLIDDFESGEAKIVYENLQSTITGIMPVKDVVLVALWGDSQPIISKNLLNGQEEKITVPGNGLGIAYGFFKDDDNGRVLVTYFGDFKDNDGGIVILER